MALADSAYAGKAVVVYVYGNLYPTKQGISSGSGNYESITNVASVVIEGKENAALRCRQGDKVIFSLYANGIPTTLKNLSLYTCTVWGGGRLQTRKIPRSWSKTAIRREPPAWSTAAG